MQPLDPVAEALALDQQAQALVKAMSKAQKIAYGAGLDALVGVKPSPPGNGHALDPPDEGPPVFDVGEPQPGVAPAAKGSMVAESALDFMARVSAKPELSWLVGDLLPDEGVVVWHGRPRSMKSLTALDVVLSVTLGEACALQNPRFKVTRPVGWLWLAEEDPERITNARMSWLLADRHVSDEGLTRLRLKVRPGWDLESDLGQDDLLRTIHETTESMGVPLEGLTIDPVRSSLPSIDGGPSDAAKGRAFLLRIMRETTVKTILLPHHDVKPPRQGVDDRSRTERASGGVTFSMGDCMVNFERVTDRQSLAYPTAYKTGADPKPFKVTFESASESGHAFETFVRAVATTTDEHDELRAKVLAFVKKNAWKNTSAIEAECSAKKGVVAKILVQLEAAGLIEMTTGPAALAHGAKSQNAHLWGPAGWKLEDEE